MAVAASVGKVGGKQGRAQAAGGEMRAAADGGQQPGIALGTVGGSHGRSQAAAMAEARRQPWQKRGGSHGGGQAAPP